MGGIGSGGANRLPVDLHILNGTFRADRHIPKAADSTPVSPADRKATLAGLGPMGRKIAGRVLNEYAGWDQTSLHTLRQYGLSCDRLAVLTDDTERRREVRTNLALLKALALERDR